VSTGRAERLRELLGQPRFQRLLATRLTSQCADGVFQTSLAGAVLFNPEHHTGPGKVAVGLTVLLLPYSLVGPFAGVLLDRWLRQRVLTLGAVLHAVLAATTAVFLVVTGPDSVAFALAALAALAVNRFFLAALSAALPHVAPPNRLVLANALSPTAGTVLTIVGGGVGLTVRAIAGSGDHGNAVVATVAAAGYLLAAAVASSLPQSSLGPIRRARTRLRTDLAAVVGEFVAGARHVRERPAVSHAFIVICGQRFLFGIWTIITLLLYRNSFHDEGLLRAGLTGVGQTVAVGGAGLVLGALATPRVAEVIGTPRWITVLTAALAVTVCGLGAPFAMPPLLVSALALGFATQATKVCVDTIVQLDVDDDFRGRGFYLRHDLQRQFRCRCIGRCRRRTDERQEPCDAGRHVSRVRRARVLVRRRQPTATGPLSGRTARRAARPAGLSASAPASAWASAWACSLIAGW
jgi:MFS family permease